jgi:hypothetical protein
MEHMSGGIIMTAELVQCAVGGVLFAVAAFVHLRWPDKVKQLTESAGRLLHMRREWSSWDVEYYRMVGWFFVVCVIATGIGVVLVVVTPQ